MPSVTKTVPSITPATVAKSYRFVVGVDTHAATHSYAVLDAAGTLIDEQTFPTTAAGISRARDWIARRTQGELDGVLVAAEGTGSYGAVLAETLAEVGYRVVEAPTPRRERGRGKTDAMDAVTAAARTRSRSRFSPPRASNSTPNAYAPSTRSPHSRAPTTSAWTHAER